MFCGEADVSGGESESIGFTDGGKSDDFNGHIQIPNHTADKSDLLEVLVAKDGKIRLDDVEELEHYGEDSVKMTGPTRTTKVFGEQRFGNQNRVVALIERFFFRSESQINPFFFTQREVGLQGARIVVQVSNAVKLDWIDENRDGHCAGWADKSSAAANQS